MPLSSPGFGNGRRRKLNSKKKPKKSRGIYPGHREDKLAAKQAKWDRLELSNNAKEILDEISLKAARGYQAPQTDYDVWQHLRDIYTWLFKMPDNELVALLDELSSFDRTRRGSTKFGSLFRAASARWYENPKRVSWAAKRLETALKKQVLPKDFEEHCEQYGRRRLKEAH